ncbi:MAG: SDR family oxidoreductase [Planctomycetes bacterium]|nr:SDR family oxidoreductase [Planctomycetota bacterium]
MTRGLFDLTAKVALVTGSSRGLGLVMARGLGEAGAAVILNGRDQQKLARAAEGLRAAGLKAHGCAFDVTDAQAVARGVDAAEREAGPIDILVNNAGIQRRAALEDMEEAAWREVLDTNLTSAFLVSRRVVRGMMERQRGKIINVCSLMSEVGRATTGNYAAAKGGLKMLTRAMAVEWARHNIQANGIGPGYFLTEMTRPLAEDPQFDAWLRARTPAGRWGDPAELVGAAVFLASRASDFVSGQIIYVDGGILASL